MAKYADLMAQVTRHCSAWISPTGEFHPVKECRHRSYAIEKILEIDYDHESANFATEHLEDLGWLHLSYGNICNRGPGPITQAQIDTLFDFACLVATDYSSPYSRNLTEAVRKLTSAA